MKAHDVGAGPLARATPADGAASSLGPLLHQFNASGVLDRPKFKQALSRLLA